MAHTIVLAHGLFGFGNPIELPSFVNYFNGVAGHLERRGHRVIVPQVNPVGSIAQRGDHLAAAIQRAIEPGERVHIIAHSMGGLDARHAITNVFKKAEPVATLITIGTPHLGSAVADAIANPADPLFAHIPAMLLKQLERNAGALHDLTTAFCEHFDASTPDIAGVRYIQVAGNAAHGGHELFFFQLAAAIAHLKDEVNDGVVTRRSALRLPKRASTSASKVPHENLEDWPGDHGSEVGWSFASAVPIVFDPLFLEGSPHLKRYDDLVARLK